MRLPPLPTAVLALGLLSPAPAVLAQAVGDERPPHPAGASGPAQGTGPPPAETPLTVLTGRVQGVDLARHVVVLEVSGAVVTLGLDRNTLVYLPGGLATIYALNPGEEVRAGRNGEDVAYWIEVRAMPAAPPPPSSTPGQGTGPGGGTPAPPERAGPPTPTTPSTGTPR